MIESPFMMRRCLLEVQILEDRVVPAVHFRFDYSNDTSGFFDNPFARLSLQFAADSVSARLGDSLSAIVPSGGNSWQAVFLNPITDQVTRLDNLVIGTDEILVFAAGAPLSGRTLGATGKGTGVPEGSAAWKETVNSRGQAAEPFDNGPWGGMIAFDSAVSWNFGATAPTRTQYDFLSVAEHELFHILGFSSGTPSFKRYVTPYGFIGPTSVAVHGGIVPLESSRSPGHWAEDTMSDGRLAAMTPSESRGSRSLPTTLDYAGLADIGWELGSQTTAVNRPTSPVLPTGSGVPRFAVGFGAGGGPIVNWLNRNGESVGSLTAFNTDFLGGVRVATADFDGDGFLDVAVGSGPGFASRVRVISGRTENDLFTLAPFEESFTGGVFVAAGDINGDDVPELVITPDEGGGPRVRVFDGDDFGLLADFFGIDDPAFRGGARAAIGDINGDAVGDLLVAAGFGGGPRVSGYDGKSVAANQPTHLFNDFFAFETALRNGVYLAAGDLDGDGFAEVITGAGPGGGPRVSAFDGKLLQDRNQMRRVADLFAGEESGRGRRSCGRRRP